MNALKSGNYSHQVKTLLSALVKDPELRDALLAHQRAERRKQRKARMTAASILSIIIEGKPAPRRTLVELGNNQEFFVRFLSKLVAKAREISENNLGSNTISENNQNPDSPLLPKGRDGRGDG